MAYETVVFKKIGAVELQMRVYRPEANRVAGLSEPQPAAGARPGMLLFVCGSWNGFDLDNTIAAGSYLASRGAVVFATQVRVKPVHDTSPTECVIDAKSAVRWVRAHAGEYGVDPEKIVCMGGSAAGHVSSCTALIADFNDPADDLNISARPNAVTIFCPVLVVYHTQTRVDRFGGPERARALSPILHVSADAPPFLIQFGLADPVVVPEEAVLFKKEMDRVGARCDLHLYPNEGHGFNGYFDGKNPMFYITMRKLDAFLAGLQFLQGAPTVDSFPFETVIGDHLTVG